MVAKHTFQTASSSVPQVDAVAEGHGTRKRCVCSAGRLQNINSRLQTAYSSVPQVDAVAESATKLLAVLAQLHGFSTPLAAAAAEVVTKRILQIAYSSQLRK